MSLSRTKTWAFGEKLTSDQINAVDGNIVNALDKRSGQTDTLASAVTVTGATTFSGTTAINGAMTVTAPITTSNTITTNAGIVFNAGNSITGNMRLAGTQTVGTGGTISVTSGGSISIYTGADLQVQGGMEIVSSGVLTVQGSGLLNVLNGGSITLQSGAVLSLLSGSSLAIGTGAVTRGGNSIIPLVGTRYIKLPATTFTTTSGSFVDMTSLTTSITAQAGDVLAIDFRSAQYNPSDTAVARIMVNDGGSDIDPGESVSTLSAQSGIVSVAFIYTVVNAGTVTVRAQGRIGSAGTATFYGGASSGVCAIRVLQYRP
jgi:fibronectin-binding autotransporter adhesin